MANIESVLQESRVFPPPAAFTAQANVKPADFERMNAAAAADYPGFWAGLAREHLIWKTPFTKSLDDSGAPFYKWFEDGTLNVSYNCLERNLQNGNANKVGDRLRGRRRQGDEGHLPGPLSPRLPVRQRPQVARRPEGRPRHRLHADVDRGRGRDAGLRPHRRDAFRRVRRILRQVAAGTHHRRRRGGGDHGGRAGARRQAPAAQSHRGRSAEPWWLRKDPQRHRLPAYRRQGRVGREARRLDARARGEAGGHVRAGVGQRRTSAVHPLHVGLHRQAEGRAAQFRRLPAVGDPDDEVDVRHQAAGSLLVHRRHRLGDRAHVHRCTDRSPWARPKSCSKACRRTRMRAASGR